MKRRTAFVCAFFLALCVSATSARADSIVECSTGLSIASLQQSGGCISGDLFFSNFRYDNSGLQISPSVYVTPSNVLASATPFSATFSTDYGVGGGFSNCAYPLPNSQLRGTCIEEEGSIGYDVSVISGAQQIAGLALLGGFADQGALGYAYVQEFGCLGLGNSARPFGAGVAPSPDYIRQTVCLDPSNAAYLLPLGAAVKFDDPLPFATLFSPVSTISIDVGLFVDPAVGGQPVTLPPFSNAFLLVPSRAPEPSSLALMLCGLLVLTTLSKKRKA